MSERWLMIIPDQIRVDVDLNSAGSAVGMTHLPTGLCVECSEFKSETENRRWALHNLTNLVMAMDAQRTVTSEPTRSS